MPSKQEIFRRGSTTYYFSSIFFPRTVRKEVFTFYAYVRTVDDYVDAIPQDRNGFFQIKKMTEEAWIGKQVTDEIVNDFVQMAKEKKFEKRWIMAFLDAMEKDLTVKKYETFEDLETYMYGSAEVIGLGMARILGLPDESLKAAKLQGKAMQLINFIRDIKEDLEFGRVYLPQEDIRTYHINELSENVDKNKFSALIRFEIERYFAIQKEAARGYRYIPRRYRIPVQTAADMYNWTAREIMRDPMTVFKKKLKPHPLQVISRIMKHSLFS